MSYIYRCGCVGDSNASCPTHNVGHVIQSSATPETLNEKKVCRERKTKVILSKKKVKLTSEFNLIFLPSASRSIEKTLNKGDPIHNHVSQFFARKHMAIINSSLEDLAVNLCSIYHMGYEDSQIRILTSLRMYDVDGVTGLADEFRGYVIAFGSHGLNGLPKQYMYLGQLCSHEAALIKKDWVKSVLDYDSHSFRPYLGMGAVYTAEENQKKKIKKSMVVKTPYVEIFNAIERGTLSTDALRCITSG